MFDNIIGCLAAHFGLGDVGRYAITITEGTTYKFEEWPTVLSLFNVVISEGESGHIGGVCKKAFKKIFFVPEAGKRYDITVEKLRKKK